MGESSDEEAASDAAAIASAERGAIDNRVGYDAANGRKRIKSEEDFAKEKVELDSSRAAANEALASYVADRGADPCRPERYDALLKLMADARDLRASQYLWLQMLEDGVDPSEKAYSSLYALVAKIHLLENRSQLSSLPYLDFKSMAPPKKWLRDAVKAKGAEKKKEASEEYTAAVEKWLTDNIEQIDSNAFKTATAVARAIPELSAAKARVILVKMKKDGTLKRIKDSDTTDPTSLGFQGAGTAEERSDRKKPKKSKKAKKEAKQEKKRRREEKFGAGVPEAHKPKKIDFGDSDNSSGSSRPPKRAKGVKAKVPKESWMTGAA